jgi:hypothetical protein
MNDHHNHAAPAPHQIRLQSVWDPPRFGGDAWRRQFGRPAGIEPGIRVILVVEEPAVALLTLNGVQLPIPARSASRWSQDVTDILVDRNELVLVPAATTAPAIREPPNAHGRLSLPATVGRVFLEILTPAGVDQ